jgi:hypothetical protein
VYPIWQGLLARVSGPNQGQNEDHPICQADVADFDLGDEEESDVNGVHSGVESTFPSPNLPQNSAKNTQPP